MIRPGLRSAFALIGLLAAVTACGQTFYKWVDAKGVTHYSEERPAADAQVVTLRQQGVVSEEPAKAATTATAPDATRSLAAAAVEFGKQACQTARENLKVLDSGRMVLASGTVSDPSGVETATKLSGEQREAAKTAALKDIETYCSPG